MVRLLKRINPVSLFIGTLLGLVVGLIFALVTVVVFNSYYQNIFVCALVIGAIVSLIFSVPTYKEALWKEEGFLELLFYTSVGFVIGASFFINILLPGYGLVFLSQFLAGALIGTLISVVSFLLFARLFRFLYSAYS